MGRNSLSLSLFRAIYLDYLEKNDFLKKYCQISFKRMKQPELKMIIKNNCNRNEIRLQNPKDFGVLFHRSRRAKKPRDIIV